MIHLCGFTYSTTVHTYLNLRYWDKSLMRAVTVFTASVFDDRD